MLIPYNFSLFGLKIPSMLVVAVLGFLFWLFIVWYEGRKDGFESNKILDLAFVSSFISGLGFYFFSSFYTNLTIFHPTNPILKLDYELTATLVCFLLLFFPVIVLSRKWRWSVYRLLDIFAMGLSLFVFLFTLGRFLIFLDYYFLAISILNLIFYLEVLRFRGYKFSSGIMFSLFLLFTVACGTVFLRRDGYLLIYGFLFTISLVNLVFRRKKEMSIGSLPKDFVELVRKKLLARDKSLRDSQQLLVKEDPYLQENRAEGNSEDMDEAILEDYQKQVNDESKSIVRNLRTQIRRALSAMKIGKYGICELCGQKIDKARLEAYPEATMCFDCSSKLSQKAEK